jgi:hypothetical protein
LIARAGSSGARIIPMINFRRNDVEDFPVKGQWRAVRDEQKFRGAIIACPGCNQAYRIGFNGHTIAQDGGVSPAVWCDCGFHEYIKLDDWIPQ